MQPPLDTTFKLPNLNISGKLWGDDDAPKAIALHGWYDNANTFDWLIPELKGLNVFAMDLAGHGHTGHRRASEPQRGVADFADIIGVARAMGWEKFTLIGHSMGAEVASLFAGVYPEMVERLICIDGFAGVHSEVGSSFDEMRDATECTLKQGGSPRVYESKQEMADRLTEVLGISPEAGYVMMMRGIKPVPGGYTWSSDPRQRGTGPYSPTEDQFRVLLSDRLKAPTLIIRGKNGAFFERTFEILNESGSRPDHIELIYLEGGHHLHLSREHVGAVADAINEFVQRD